MTNEAPYVICTKLTFGERKLLIQLQVNEGVLPPGFSKYKRLVKLLVRLRDKGLVEFDPDEPLDGAPLTEAGHAVIMEDFKTPIARPKSRRLRRSALSMKK